jgi:hypothetical protein
VIADVSVIFVRVSEQVAVNIASKYGILEAISSMLLDKYSKPDEEYVLTSSKHPPPSNPTTESLNKVERRTYSSIQVFETDVNGVRLFLRCEDSYVNATRLLKLTDVEPRKMKLALTRLNMSYIRLITPFDLRGMW